MRLCILSGVCYVHWDLTLDLAACFEGSLGDVGPQQHMVTGPHLTGTQENEIVFLFAPEEPITSKPWKSNACDA